MSREEITVNNANGYSGTLHGREMTIYYRDEEVLHTYAAAATNEAELDEVLETMPQFMDMLNEQVKNAISKGAEHGKI